MRTTARYVGVATAACHGLAGFKTGIQYAMTNLSYTLSTMMNTADGTGNLLDNSMVYVTSCVGEPANHAPHDYPVLVAGKVNALLT